MIDDDDEEVGSYLISRYCLCKLLILCLRVVSTLLYYNIRDTVFIKFLVPCLQVVRTLC